MKSSQIGCWGICLLCWLIPVFGRGQGYFGNYGSATSMDALTTPMASDLPTADNPYLPPATPGAAAGQNAAVDNANFAIGPVLFNLGAGVGIEANDNITLSHSHRVADVAIRPNLLVDASWQLTSMNTLRFSVGFSYAKYVSHPEFDSDSILISPLSALEFRFLLGQVRFTAFDRFSYQEDPFDIADASNIARFGRYENEIGLQADYDLNSDTHFSAGYSHFNLWTTGNGFESQDRTTDTLFFKPSYQLFPTLGVGVNTRFSWVSFASSARGDGTNLMVGPFAQWAITPYTNMYAEVGYQRADFGNDDTNALRREVNQELGLSSDDDGETDDHGGGHSGSNSYYVRLDLDNTPSETYRQRLSFIKSTEIGFLSNSFDLYHVEYTGEWSAIKNTSISPTFFYEYFESTGGELGDQSSRFGAAVTVRHRLTNFISLGLDYRFSMRDSNIEGANYYQNLAFLSLLYKF